MNLQTDTKAFIILGIAVGLVLLAFIFDMFIMNLMFDDATLWGFSYSALILEIIATALIGWAIYIRFPNSITKMFPFVFVGLASGLLLLEYKQQWYKVIDYNIIFIYLLCMYMIITTGFTFISVGDNRDIQVEFILIPD